MENKTIDQLTNEHIEILNKFDEVDLNDFARSYWVKQYHNVRIQNNTLKEHCIDKRAYNFANESLKMMYNTLNYDIEEL
ncbi:MAG: hypothetical protein ACOC56_07095 [Atribacterota bacterium]